VTARRTRRRVLLVLPLLVAVPALAGCPKRPMLSTASAPSPPGAPVLEASAPPHALPPAAVEPTVPPAPSPLAPVLAAPASPRPARVPLAEYRAHAALPAVHFDFDRWDIRPADRKSLEASAAWLRANDRQEVLIEGHCDQRGTAEYNMALGDKRAKAVLVYLAEQGVSVTRLSTISFGDERLLCEDPTGACWGRNRRAALLTREKRTGGISE
jgi:peptidoglycan-associated lipoprotein